MIAYYCVWFLLAADSSWQSLFSEDGITVYQKDTGLILPMLRAEGVLDLNLYEVAAVLQDYPRHREWMRKLTVSRVVHKKSDFDFIAYNRFDSPWPASDRDALVHVDAKLDPEKQSIVVDMRPTKTINMPPPADVVRVTDMRLYFELRYLAPKQTEVFLEMYIDPGGSIPSWVVRWMVQKIPFKTLKGLHRQVRRTHGQYKKFIQQYDPAAQSTEDTSSKR